MDKARPMAFPASLDAIPSRQETFAIMAENVYGVRPELEFERTEEVVSTEEVEQFDAIRKIVKISTPTPLGVVYFNAVAYFPEKSGRVPVFSYISFRDSMRTDDDRWPIGLILERGCATVAFNYNDVLKDDAKVLDGVERPANGWGAIDTWAFAATRVNDWLVKEERVDSSKIALVGLSRLGKAALWAGAQDERFAMVCPNCSGLFGARMTTRNIGGETIAQITSRFPHWFAPNCGRLWSGKDKELPFDQHWLLAAVAPRLLAVGSALDDAWACPSAEMAGWECSRAAWADKSSSVYHVRPGEHEIKDSDWKEYLDFAACKKWFEA